MLSTPESVEHKLGAFLPRAPSGESAGVYVLAPRQVYRLLHLPCILEPMYVLVAGDEYGGTRQLRRIQKVSEKKKMVVSVGHTRQTMY